MDIELSRPQCVNKFLSQQVLLNFSRWCFSPNKHMIFITIYFCWSFSFWRFSCIFFLIEADFLSWWCFSRVTLILYYSLFCWSFSRWCFSMSQETWHKWHYLQWKLQSLMFLCCIKRLPLIQVQHPCWLVLVSIPRKTVDEWLFKDF